MDAEQARIQAAHLKNLAYLKRLDEGGGGSVSKRSSSTSSSSGMSRKKQKRAGVNIYVNGLKTFIGCKQLEGLCKQIGQVKRVKFYKDSKGGLKGDALVTFAWSSTILEEALARVRIVARSDFVLSGGFSCISFSLQLNDCEIKPGEFIT